MAHGAAHAVRDRSQDNKMNTLGLFSDLNYTTINDPYDDVALRRMLSNRLERPGHGRYKLPTLKTAPRLPRTQEWKRSSAWKASSYPKRGTMTKDAFFSTTDWKSDPYSLKQEKEWAYRQMIESKVLFGNFLPPSGDKTLRTRSSKITSQPTQAFWAGTPNSTPKGH